MDDIKHITKEFFTAIEQEGLRSISRFLTDDVVWWVAGVGEIQHQFRELDEMLDTHIDGRLELKILDIIADGDKVAAEGESLGRLKNGQTYNNKYHFKLFFKNGKIKQVKEYNDTKHGADIWGAVLA